MVIRDTPVRPYASDPTKNGWLRQNCSSVKGRSLGSLLAELLNGNTVHVHGALLGEALAHSDGLSLIRLVLGLANEAELLELLEAVADVLASGHSGGLSPGATVSLATVVLAEALNATLLSHVELVADRGGAGVKPVIIKGGKLAVAGGLNGL